MEKMEKIECKQCGSIDIVKTADNLFQCRYCGCRYTLKQVRMPISGSVTAKQPDFTIRAGVLIRYNGAATKVVIPEGIVAIGEGAFKDCLGLTSVILPEGVEAIRKEAFAGCSRLKGITFPNGVKEIGEHAFLDCSSLDSIKIPESIDIIGGGAFGSCSSLTDIVLPDKKIRIDILYRRVNEDRTEVLSPFHDCPGEKKWKFGRMQCNLCGGRLERKKDGLFHSKLECRRCGRCIY